MGCPLLKAHCTIEPLYSGHFGVEGGVGGAKSLWVLQCKLYSQVDVDQGYVLGVLEATAAPVFGERSLRNGEPEGVGSSGSGRAGVLVGCGGSQPAEAGSRRAAPRPSCAVEPRCRDVPATSPRSHRVGQRQRSLFTAKYGMGAYVKFIFVPTCFRGICLLVV